MTALITHLIATLPAECRPITATALTDRKVRVRVGMPAPLSTYEVTVGPEWTPAQIADGVLRFLADVRAMTAKAGT